MCVKKQPIGANVQIRSYGEGVLRCNVKSGSGVFDLNDTVDFSPMFAYRQPELAAKRK